MNKIALLLLVVAQIVSANPRDIFTNDTETRRPAENEEFDMALELKGCTGYLLAPTIGATAAHCLRIPKQLKSGIALKFNEPSDGMIGKTLEIDERSDYWIFEIKWNNNSLPVGMQYVPAIQTKMEDLAIGDNTTADKLYTVGFPIDKGNKILYYAYGYGKSDGRDGAIKNNIGLINGNSGGAILREFDNMLVSSVSGGPHAFQQPGWENNDWNDATHWNAGPAMWKVYRSSKIFQGLFPDGRNKYLSPIWNLQQHSLMHQLTSHF